MRIAVWYNLPSGGGKRALHDHVRGLLALGHDLEAWAPETRDASYLPLADLIPEHVVPLNFHWSATPWERLGLSSRAANIAAKMEAHCRACAEQINAGGFDVVLANSCMLTATAPLARFLDMPSVLYLQEPFRVLYEALPDMVWPAPAPGTPIKRKLADRRNVSNARIQVREEIASARAFDRILCNSYYSRESILRAYGVTPQVCYLGTDVNRFSAGPDERDPYVIGLGALNNYKGEIQAIDAIAAMQGERPKLLWIANAIKNGWLDHLEAHASARQVELEVRLRVPDEELIDCLRRATAMVYSPRLEPFGYAPIEAGACATPLVAVAEGGVRETVVDGVNGILVEPNAESMAAALDRLFGNKDFARRLGRNGREVALTKWSVEEAAKRLERELSSQLRADSPAIAARR
jgi:glycosyltransferase involved in cell wall biosynthesis